MQTYQVCESVVDFLYKTTKLIHFKTMLLKFTARFSHMQTGLRNEIGYILYIQVFKTTV